VRILTANESGGLTQAHPEKRWLSAGRKLL